MEERKNFQISSVASNSWLTRPTAHVPRYGTPLGQVWPPPWIS